MSISLRGIDPQIISRSCAAGVSAFVAVVVAVAFAVNILQGEIHSGDYDCGKH